MVPQPPGDAARFWFLRLPELACPGLQAGLWLCLSVVGADRSLHVGQKVGSDPVQSFSCERP